MVVKTGVSIPDDVYRKLMELMRALGYTSTSKAIRDAIELFIAFNRWWTAGGPVAGVIQVVGRVGSRSLERVRELESEFKGIVRFSVTVPVNGNLVFHLIFVDGDGGDVKELYRRLASIDGLLAVQTALLPS